MAIDRSGMPELIRFQARDGTSLAYRLYPAANGDTQKIAIVIHGSGGHSTGMNEIAKRLAAGNFLVIAPDMRGHGGSGTRGDIGYYGQLDDDLDDLVAELRQRYLVGHFALLGFSSGGGFALRAAAGKLSSAFDRVVLLSPYLGYDATSTPQRRRLGGMGERGHPALACVGPVAPPWTSLLRSPAGHCLCCRSRQRKIRHRRVIRFGFSPISARRAISLRRSMVSKRRRRSSPAAPTN